MNKNIYLSKYWLSMMNGEPDLDIAVLIKEAVLNNDYDYLLLLEYLGKIVVINDFSDSGIELFGSTWELFGMPEWNTCNISKDSIEEYAKAFQILYGSPQGRTDYARAVWNALENVEDGNSLKQAILNSVFNDLVYFGDYSDLELIQKYTNYVSNIPEDGELITLPSWMRISSRV